MKSIGPRLLTVAIVDAAATSAAAGVVWHARRVQYPLMAKAGAVATVAWARMCAAARGD